MGVGSRVVSVVDVSSLFGGFLCVEEVSTGAFALNGVTDDPCWFSSSHHTSLFFPPQLLRTDNRSPARIFCFCASINLDSLSSQNDDLLGVFLILCFHCLSFVCAI